MNIKIISSFNDFMTEIRNMGIMNECMIAIVVAVLILLNSKGVI